MIDCNNTSSHLDKFVNAHALKRNPVNGLETSNIVSKKIERENRRTLTESVDDRVPLVLRLRRPHPRRGRTSDRPAYKRGQCLTGLRLDRNYTKIYSLKGAHQSSVVSSAPRVRIPSTPSTLFSICIIF